MAPYLCYMAIHRWASRASSPGVLYFRFNTRTWSVITFTGVASLCTIVHFVKTTPDKTRLGELLTGRGVALAAHPAWKLTLPETGIYDWNILHYLVIEFIIQIDIYLVWVFYYLWWADRFEPPMWGIIQCVMIVHRIVSQRVLSYEDSITQIVPKMFRGTPIHLQVTLIKNIILLFISQLSRAEGWGRQLWWSH